MYGGTFLIPVQVPFVWVSDVSCAQASDFKISPLKKICFVLVFGYLSCRKVRMFLQSGIN